MAPRLKPLANEPADETRLKNSLVALAAHRRDAILEAIAMSAKELLRSSNLDASLPKVIERVGQAAGVDRLHILLRDGKRDRPNTMSSDNTIPGTRPAFHRRPII